MTVDGFELGRVPCRGGQQSDREVSYGTAEVDRVEVSLVQLMRAVREACEMLLPRCHGVRLVKPDCLCNEVPEALHVGLSEDLPRPALVWIGHARPVHRAFVEDDLGPSLHELLRARPADAATVDAFVDVRVRIACDAERGTSVLVQVFGLRETPRRRPLESFLVRMLEHRAPHVLIAIEDVHSPCTCFVRGGRDGACEGRVLDVTGDMDVLARTKVEPDPDAELRVATHEVVRRHAAILWRASAAAR
jgi:hypothetical protein